MFDFDFGQLFTRGFRNLSQAISAIYFLILRTSPLPDWIDFLLILALIVVVIRLILTWMSPRR